MEKMESLRYLNDLISSFLSGNAIQYKLNVNGGIWGGCSITKDNPEKFKQVLLDNLGQGNLKILDSYMRVKPEPVKVPLTIEDIPPVCWINDPKLGNIIKYNVVSFNNEGLTIIYNDNFCTLSYDYLKDENWRMSSDLMYWLQCYKEIDK